MCVDYKLCVKLQKDPFAFNMEKLENFYTHAVTDNYQVCTDPKVHVQKFSENFRKYTFWFCIPYLILSLQEFLNNTFHLFCDT